MDKKKLHNLIEKEQPNICQVFTYKDGNEIYSDEWNNYKKNDCTHVMSATKSIVSLLIGIALDKGLIHTQYRR
jgi:hypothetical protein